MDVNWDRHCVLKTLTKTSKTTSSWSRGWQQFLVLDCPNESLEHETIHPEKVVNFLHLLGQDRSSENHAVNNIHCSPNNSAAWISAGKIVLFFPSILPIVKCPAFPGDILIFPLHLLSSLTYIEQPYNPSWDGMDRGVVSFAENHRYCNFHLQNRETPSAGISVVVQFGCWTEEGALQIAWAIKRPWLWTLKTARGRQTPNAEGNLPWCSQAVWPGERLARRLQAAWTRQ